MDKEIFVEFMNEYIFSKYKDHLIIMDNASGDRNNYVWNAIEQSSNKYLHSVPYTPITNPIEAVQNMLEIVNSIFTIGKRLDVFFMEVNS
jgi:transposase